jgi:response regulator RpfG family c-di-GMP phosphodiesterase
VTQIIIVKSSCGLPRKDGTEVLNEIKTYLELGEIPDVVLTSSHAEIDVVKSYELRANSYVPKPADLKRLKGVVASTENFWCSAALLPSPRTTRTKDGT